MAKANKKQISKKVANIASGILRNENSTPEMKSVAASDLAQARNHKKKRR